MIYCNKCGNEIEDNYTFCDKCGQAVNGEVNGNADATVYGNATITPPQNTYNPTWAAVSSLVLGIVGMSLCVYFFIPSLLALIFGIIGRKSTQKGIAIAGIVLGIVGMVLSGLILTFYFVTIFSLFDSIPYYNGTDAMVFLFK